MTKIRMLMWAQNALAI